MLCSALLSSAGAAVELPSFAAPNASIAPPLLPPLRRSAACVHVSQQLEALIANPVRRQHALRTWACAATKTTKMWGSGVAFYGAFGAFPATAVGRSYKAAGAATGTPMAQHPAGFGDDGRHFPARLRAHAASLQRKTPPVACRQGWQRGASRFEIFRIASHARCYDLAIFIQPCRAAAVGGGCACAETRNPTVAMGIHLIGWTRPGRPLRDRGNRHPLQRANRYETECGSRPRLAIRRSSLAGVGNIGRIQGRMTNRCRWSENVTNLQISLDEIQLS